MSIIPKVVINAAAGVVKTKKIMVVDDDQFCCQFIKMMLESLG